MYAMRERADRLRELLRTATDFREPWDYFHDKLVLDPRFMRLGAPSASKKLTSALTAIGSRLLRREITLESPVLLQIKEWSLWHGSCGFGEYTGVCFYFDDADQGLVGLMKDLSGRETLLARISLLPLAAGATGVTRGGQA